MGRHLLSLNNLLLFALLKFGLNERPLKASKLPVGALGLSGFLLRIPSGGNYSVTWQDGSTGTYRVGYNHPASSNPLTGEISCPKKAPD